MPRMARRRDGFSQLRFDAYRVQLAAEIDAMRFRITEPTFFWGKHREVDEIMEAPTGPYRNFATGGGLQRIPQFVEMPDEIKQVIQAAASGSLPSQQGEGQAALNAMPPQSEGAAAAGTFAEATAAALKPATPAAKPKGNPLAARIRALTTRRAKFQDDAAAILAPAETAMTEVEANGPAILKRAATASTDELTAITDLADSLKDLDATNGPLEG